MSKVSVIIPARNEEYLINTLNDVLSKARGDVEILVMLDGYIPEPRIETHDSRITFYHFQESIGQRQCVNEGAKLATGDYIMKLDAHCMMDEGWDEKLKVDCDYDWTVVPRMYNLDINTWSPKRHKRTDYMFITNEKGKEFRMEYYTGKQYRRLHRNPALIDDTMCLVGCCFFMHRDRFWELGGMDEGHGGWGQMGVEVACKAWLSGGALKVNKKTWFAHWFRGGGGPGFPYKISGKDVEKARKYSQDLWLNDKWPKAKRKFQWMLDKFKPPTWDKKVEEKKIESPAVTSLKDIHKGEDCYIMGRGPSLLKLEASHIGQGFVIALNQAIQKVDLINLNNKVYSMQKEGGGHHCADCKGECKGFIKTNATLLLTEDQFTNCQKSNPNRFLYDPKALSGGDEKLDFSAMRALRMAQIMGAKKIHFMCFDACTERDSRKVLDLQIVEGNWGNAKESRYVRQCKRIHEVLMNESIDFEFCSPLTMEETFRMSDYRHVITKRRNPRWRGYGIVKQPADMILYHQALWERKPDVIIETGTFWGGSAVFLGDMCELMGHGEVISIDVAPLMTPEHKRVEYIKSSSINEDLIKSLRKRLRGKKVMVILDSDHSRVHVKWELHYYSDIVSVGQFMVVEDCFRRGRDMLMGPGQAVKWFLGRNKKFKQTDYDKQFLSTLSRGGWLLKV